MAVSVGQQYRHYKGGMYRILHLARSSETDDLYDVVVYQNMAFPEKIWTQSLARFSETVEYEGNTIPRFSLVGDR